MFRRHRQLSRLLPLLLLAPSGSRAHEEWHNLHLSYSAKTAYTYPFDGRTPKIAAVLLNHYDVPAPATVFALSINGQPQNSGAFATFPNGGSIVSDPQNFGFASVLSAGIYDGRAGAAPAPGETKAFTFQFVFALAPGEVAPPVLATGPYNPDPDNNGDPPGTVSAVVRFTNLGENPTLAGPLAANGTLRLPAGLPATGVRVEVATPYTKWFSVPVVAATAGGNTSYAFAQSLPARDDWHLRFSADNCESRVVPFGYINDPHPPLDVTLAAVPAPDADYRRIAAIATPTGFWRGAVSESEGTFVVFSGQETWKAAPTDAEARALRAASRIAKYTFGGTRLWEHAPGWETWAGDMTPDGRFVAYAPNPTVQPFYTPPENKLVLLDGATGAVIWTKSAPPGDAATGRKLDALELAFSPDARWIAVGSAGAGTVTLVDRATGTFVWTAPGGPRATFGQVRKLRFSADSQFLYCGSGDSHVRKLRVADGVILWKTFAGGWPNPSGIDLTPDGTWLVAGTKSLDATMIRTSDGFLQWQRETQYADAVFSADGRHLVTAGGQIYRTLDGSLTGLTGAPGLARFTPDSRYVVQLDRELRVHDLGGKVLRTSEASGIAATSGEQPQWAYLTRDARYAVILARDLTNPPQTGIAIYERRVGAITVPPTIRAQPLAQAVALAGNMTLSVSAAGSAPLSYLWRRNGTAPASPTASAGPALTITRATAADAGTYTCEITNATGSITSAPAEVVVVAADTANPSRLTNLAVRATVGATPLIVGFSVGGAGTSGTKPLLIRGAGPSLTALGVTGALTDPRLGLFSGTTSVLANENWGGDPQVTALATQLGAFPFAASTSRDAALVATAVGGSYTAQLASSDATSGTALAEIYDGSPGFTASTPRLVNVSARTEVGGAAGVLIAGFVVAGPTARTVLIRGIGPALGNFGIRTALVDPQLTLFRDGTLVAANDNWYDAANAVAIAATSTDVGAFALPPASHDAALLLSLPPGNYTAQVGGATSDTAGGTALVEVYEVP